MSNKNVINLDVAIIGGGNAGMTLAKNLAAQRNNLVTTVFEPKTPQQRNYCWSLWATPEQQAGLKHCERGSWHKWRLVSDEEDVLLTSKKFNYLCLSSTDYLQHSEDSLEGCIDIKRSSVDNLTGQHNFISQGQDYRAEHIFDSRPPLEAAYGLKQHFLGWEIRTKQPLPDTTVATLMDFRVDQSRGLHFIYALPFSNHNLFVESTMISRQLEDKDWYRQAISEWLCNQGIEVEELIREEIGVIPMEDVTKASSNESKIGAASGAVRLSSGYAFSAIQIQMATLAKGISKGNFVIPQTTSGFLNTMDNIFNSVLLSESRIAPRIFLHTAKALNGDQFAHFMLGSAGFFEWFKVVFSMPKVPFIKQAWRQVFKHD
ncbi:MAG: lycopene cyclase family protein [Porticoccaceae bacterium]|nr:lycopene cyclase family protein [Porticoccaceae bacterium]MDG1474387.1 lycopene cyclase family protein [Porticoccaceae bacterium]